jgi:EthD domain
MTYKVFGILKRPDGMTFEQFKKWWLEVHVPRVMKWPNLVAYDVNFALNENEPFDGVGIVYFDTKEAAERVFQTLEGSAFRRYCRDKPKCHLSGRGSCHRSSCKSPPGIA